MTYHSNGALYATFVNINTKNAAPFTSTIDHVYVKAQSTGQAVHTKQILNRRQMDTKYLLRDFSRLHRVWLCQVRELLRQIFILLSDPDVSPRFGIFKT